MRLIDADALEKQFRKEANTTACLDNRTYWSEALISVAEDVVDAPTIDAVPVVRCKDCRFHEQEQPGMVYCPATVGGWVDEDWFCKGGERRSE